MPNNILKMDCSSSDPAEHTVTIKLSHYDEIVKASLLLQALQTNGVDNWEWYGDSFPEYNKLLKLHGFEVED